MDTVPEFLSIVSNSVRHHSHAVDPIWNGQFRGELPKNPPFTASFPLINNSVVREIGELACVSFERAVFSTPGCKFSLESDVGEQSYANRSDATSSFPRAFSL